MERNRLLASLVANAMIEADHHADTLAIRPRLHAQQVIDREGKPHRLMGGTGGKAICHGALSSTYVDTVVMTASRVVGRQAVSVAVLDRNGIRCESMARMNHPVADKASSVSDLTKAPRKASSSRG
jgi:hypothetical protein